MTTNGCAPAIKADAVKTYQVITHLGWRHQPAVNPKPWTDNEALRSASSLIIAAVDELAHSEVHEIFLESMPEVFEWIEQSEKCDRRLVIAQAATLLDIWLERGRPNWKDLIENLTRAVKLLHSLADMAELK